MGADSTFAKGDRVDRFEIRELIGQGGMGAIYRAVDTKLSRTVALKVVRTDRLGSTSREEVRQRFLRETLAMSKVDHRNVVRVLDFGFAGDTPYLAMEYLRGQDLGRLVKATAGFLPISEVVDVLLEVCAAIRACHDAGIIHRDLKPSNIFLCENDGERVVKVLDFGVSKPPVAGDLTREGQIVGTPQYLAPEQIDGKAVRATDQYAVGVMLYACLTKTLPYQDRASFGLLQAILLGKFTPPRAVRSDLPEALEGIILRAMRTAPAERFESIQELGRALWEFASPQAREKWRAYYFDERLRAPPKASTHAMPLIEAMARGIAERPAGAPTALASTALDQEAFAVRPGTPAPTAPTADGPSSGPSAHPSAAPTRPAGVATRRSVAPFVAAGAVALAAAGWLLLRRPDDASTPKAKAPASSVAPARPAPPVSTTTTAPRPPTPGAEPAPARPEPGAASPPVPAARSSPTRAEKPHRRNDRGRTSEQAADGVPIMP